MSLHPLFAEILGAFDMSEKDTYRTDDGLLWPVFEFRPLPEHSRGTVLRYADGQWLPDDGEHDIAFVSYGAGAPYGLYVRLPYHRNILWSGLTQHWRGHDARHPRGNPWHYLLREGETEGNYKVDSRNRIG